MKKLIPILSMLFMLLTGSTYASLSPGGDISKEVTAALNTGNFKEIAKYFNNTIDLTVPGNDGSYSKTHAELILKDFFEKYQVKGFTLNHQGNSNDGSQFIIGTLNTQKGNFRTYCFFKKINNVLNIQQLQFEKNQ